MPMSTCIVGGVLRPMRDLNAAKKGSIMPQESDLVHVDVSNSSELQVPSCHTAARGSLDASQLAGVPARSI